MNLILWRHAEAEDNAASDLARQLTSRGQKQAQAAAKWLASRIDDKALFLVSPAARTIQTAEALRFGIQNRRRACARRKRASRDPCREVARRQRRLATNRGRSRTPADARTRGRLVDDRP